LPSSRTAGRIPSALELLSKGRELADRLKEPLTAVLFGGDEEAPGILLRQGADLVYHCADARLRVPDEELYLPIFAELVERHCPAILLFGATPFGRSLAPRLAARLRTGLTADCTELDIDSETRLLRQTARLWGNLMATIVCPDHRPQMATVRPGVMALSAGRTRAGPWSRCPFPKTSSPGSS
jgi:electron transfer flavoprotein alpha subunit